MNKSVLFFYLAYLLILSIFSSADYPKSVIYNNFFPYLADKPISEDGFYMLSVAENIANGNGLQYNNGIQTTGIQPLVSFYYAAVFNFASNLPSNKIQQLRFIIFFAGLLLIPLTLILIKTYSYLYRGNNKSLLSFLASILIFLNFDLFLNFTNGLETGLYILMILSSLLMSIKYLKSGKSFKDDFIFGLVLGLTALTRVDFILPLIIYLSLLAYKRKIQIKNLVIIVFVSFLLFSSWLIYSYSITESFFQSSAASQTSLINSSNFPERLYEWVVSLSEIITLNIFFGNKETILFIVAIFISAGVIPLIIKSKTSFFSSIDPNLKLWIIAFSSLLIIYPLYSSAPYFYYRYLIPFSIFIILLIPSLITANKRILNLFTNYRKLILFSFALFFLTQTYFYFHSGKLGVHMSLRAGYIQEHFPNENVGCFQSGVAGYFNQNVFNLDGKLDHIALKAIKQNRLQEYIDSNKINVLIEWKEAFTAWENNYLKDDWYLYDDEIGDGKTVVYVRKTSLSSTLQNPM